ncbi:hypothetical protein ACHAWF_000648, partial [Thalassiosira exigua]
GGSSSGCTATSSRRRRRTSRRCARGRRERPSSLRCFPARYSFVLFGSHAMRLFRAETSRISTGPAARASTAAPFPTRTSTSVTGDRAPCRWRTQGPTRTDPSSSSAPPTREWSEILILHALWPALFASESTFCDVTDVDLGRSLISRPWLDGKHTVFGKVTKGLDIMRKMEGLGSQSGSTAKEVKIAASGAL